jgi:hypothetical protein
MKARIFFFLLLSLLVIDSFGFAFKAPPRRKCFEPPTWQKWVTWGGHGAFYVGTYIPLYYVWYKDYPKTSFHFFNDNNQWRSMDKMGHSFTAFKLASFSNRTLDWTYPFNTCNWNLGENKTKVFISAGYSMLYLTTLEVFDGFSGGWGFSWGDMGANTFGVSLFATQKMFCKETFVRPKFSYHSTNYANYRPELLGSEFYDRPLKDYNGQTYWLSAGLPVSVTGVTNKWRWISLAVGYNASGMTGGSYNPSVNQAGQIIPVPQRTSSFLVSLDVDWERFNFMRYGASMFRIKKDKKLWLRILCIALNSVKIPFPAIEFKQGGGVKVHGFYF